MSHGIKALMLWRRITLFALVGFCSLWSVAGPSPQSEPEDSTRRIWNKRFREARALARRRGRPAVNGGLLGVTIWRMRDGEGCDRAERATVGTPFNEGERLRFSIEAPRIGNSYLYVIDREIYADGSTGDPYLIFPCQTTHEGENVLTAGKPVFVPAEDDEFPYFTLERARKDHVREKLTFVLSPKPLGLPLGTPSDPIKLDRAQVAQWEKQWGRQVEKWEERGGADKQMTAAEREAGSGARRLVRGDPLPQTIYLVKAKPGRPIMLDVPLQIATAPHDSRPTPGDSK